MGFGLGISVLLTGVTQPAQAASAEPASIEPASAEPASIEPDRVLVVTTTADVVANDGAMSLREALTEAAGADVVAIELAPAATYELRCGAGDDANLTGDLDHLGANTVVIRGNGSTVTPSSIGPFGFCIKDRLFDSPGAGTLVLTDVIIDGGAAVGDGGAIRGASVELVDVMVRNSTATSGRGGAVFAQGDLRAVRSRFESNAATERGVGSRGSGGALAALGDISVIDSELSNNSATYDGGAVVAGSGRSLVMEGSTITANVSHFGRGGAVFAGANVTVSISDTVFDSNVAAAASIGGGAIYADGVITIAESRFVANEARSIEVASYLSTGGGGGAIYSEGQLTISGSTLEANSAGTAGAGGAVNHKGEARVVATTVENNQSGGAGGGLYLVGAIGLGETIDVESADVLGNQAGGTGGGGVFLSSGGTISVYDTRVSTNSVHATDGDGGGVFLRGAATIDRSTIESNSVGFDGSGGGVHAEPGSEVIVTNSTIANNAAGSGAGIDADNGPGSFVRIEHSTIAANTATVGSNLAIRSLAWFAASIIADDPSGSGCVLSQPALSLGSNIDGDGSCGLSDPTDVVVGPGIAVTEPPRTVGRHVVRPPVVAAAFGTVAAPLCDQGDRDQLGMARSVPCDVGAVEALGLDLVDDVVVLEAGQSVVVDLLANDIVDGASRRFRFSDVVPPPGVIVYGRVNRLTIFATDTATSGVIGTYSVCSADGLVCDAATFSVEIAVPEPNVVDATPDVGVAERGEA